MPIRPENRARYPKDWRQISDAIKERAGYRCECDGRCRSRFCTALRERDAGHEARCTAVHWAASAATGARVILTVAHLDHTPEHCDPSNLLALCQACHLSYDAEHHAQTATHTRALALAEQMDPLFGEWEPAE